MSDWSPIDAHIPSNASGQTGYQMRAPFPCAGPKKKFAGHALEAKELEKINQVAKKQHLPICKISYQWIADQLGFPPKTRNNLVTRMRQKLVEIMAAPSLSAELQKLVA